MKKLIFVCTGNTCRSPMAEGLLRDRLQPDCGWEISSAGVCAANGWPASGNALEALRERGIDISNLTSQPLTPELIRDADLLVTMTQGHHQAILSVAPESEGKVFLLKSFGVSKCAADIYDPVGENLDLYRRVRDEIDAALPDLILTLMGKKDGSMKIAIGADHGGFELKEKICSLLESKGIEVNNLGTYSSDSTDYPDYAAAVARQVSQGEAAQGILICNTGIGMSITANQFPRVLAAVCCTPEMAKLTRIHNASNVLCLGAHNTDEETALKILDAWLANKPERGGRHERRVNKIKGYGQSTSDAIAVYDTDPEMYKILRDEDVRQKNNIELIASENIVSQAVREVQGSRLTNKYAEGYPGKRWYNGCECVDEAEQMAIDRAKEIFGAEHVNVQPHSGSGANMAVYYSVLEPGDTILAMSLAEGGHLTHGHPMNFSGRFFNIVPYGVCKDSEQIDYDEVARLAEEHKPRMLVAGASAYSRLIDFKRLKKIADSVGAYFMVDMAHIAGLVATGCHPSPVPVADFVTTTTHKTLRGPRGGMILCKEQFAADIDRQVFPGIQGGPLMHVIAAKAVAFGEALTPEFKTYQQQVVKNAVALAEALQANGFRLVADGTDNHLILMDVGASGFTGKDVANALDKASITANKNGIPFDKKSPFVTSGVRLGTPAVTTRGMKEADMKTIADFIKAVTDNMDNEKKLAKIREQVVAFSNRFVLP